MQYTRSIKSIPFILIAATLAGCGTLSDSSDSDFHSRFYVGGGLLISELEPDTDRDPDTSLDESRSSGGAIALGYDLSNRFSVEGHLADLGEAELSPVGSLGYQVGGISALLYALGNSDNRDTRTGFSLYGRLGLGGLNNEAEDVEFERVNDVHVLGGVGVEYGFDNGLGARAEVIAHETDARYALLGLVYRFGKNSSSSNEARAASVAADAGAEALPADQVESGDNVEVQPLPSPAPVTAGVLDSDNDGVADSDDSCPGTPANSPVNLSGCEIFNGVMEGLTFLSGSAELTDGAQAVLTEAADVLISNPDVKVTIEAHTDNQGAAADNLQLSKRRAISVARFLIEKGVSGSRLRPQAFGESNPIAPNSSDTGRAANRRVEFSIAE